MPTIEINQALIYYESYGTDAADGIPVVLIHGATGSGASNWSLVAPLLARRRRVIVPDCRGHGRSTNPGGAYSFRQMAADTAALVRALGYPRAHIVGHSNGGNTALVTLLEHPEIVQAAVLQAANAYVSPDLVEKEPPVFDPERVARDAPDWRDEMIALHAEVHGREYWRSLLAITVAEIIREPNYTPADLAQVRRPTLVIEGMNDRVNAPMQHGRFIADHIPQAELWAPAGVGHNVHDERLFEWVECVEDFLHRRGDEANDLLYRLRQHSYSDDRQAIFELHAQATGMPGAIRLEGKLLESGQLQAATEALQEAGYAVENQATTLLNENTLWALANRSVDDLLATPRSASERLSQALIGEVLQVLEQGEDWCRVRLESDGYLGWMRSPALKLCSRAEAQAYQAACNAVVQAGLAPAYWQPPDGKAPELLHAGRLPFGARLRLVERQGEWAACRLPDGRLWWLRQAATLPLEQPPAADAAGIDRALQRIQAFTGVPYLWGGRSPYGYDCSGLAQAFYAFIGVTIPRDADQQLAAARRVSGAPEPGDLLFFGEPGSVGHRSISHVAISLGGSELIHANSAAWGVSTNSLDPASKRYRAWLRENLVGTGRFR